MKTWIRLFFLLFIPAIAYATPVTYVYFGEKWVDYYHPDYSTEEKAAFILGVVFPDIRYLNIRMPEEPDATSVSKEEIFDEENPFEKGRLFHYYFLQFRNAIITQQDVYSNLKNVPSDNKDLLFMLLEDHNFYEEIDRSQIKKYFSSVIEDEEYTGVPLHTLRTWHRIVSQYYGMSTFAIVCRLRQFDLGMFGASKETVAEWAREFPSLLESETFQIYLSELDRAFEMLLVSDD